MKNISHRRSQLCIIGVEDMKPYMAGNVVVMATDWEHQHRRFKE